MTDQTPTNVPTRWAAAVAAGCAAGAVPRDAGEGYAHAMSRRRLAAKAAGHDPDGEARFVHDLVGPGARVLDAGCGTGRVAVALAELGHPVVGVDADLAMVRVAAEAAPRIPFWLSDLADLDVPQAVIGGGFDAAVMAGNVVPYLAEGTVDAVVSHLASALRAQGLLIAGFGIHPDQLPAGLPVTPLAEYDAACRGAGLEPVGRSGNWDGAEWRPDSAYVVAVHRRPERPAKATRRGLRGLWGR